MECFESVSSFLKLVTLPLEGAPVLGSTRPQPVLSHFVLTGNDLCGYFTLHLFVSLAEAH